MSLLPLLLGTLLAGAPAADGTDGDGAVLRIRNPAAPPGGTRWVELEELWRVGGDDGEILFGIIDDVVCDVAGNFYVLDSQLAQVSVFSPDGEFLHTLSRGGEGPGEVQNPNRLLFLPDGTLGIAQFFPAKVVKVDLSDNPAGTLTPGGAEPSSGGYQMMDGIACRADRIVCCRKSITRGEQGAQATSLLAALDETGAELVRYLEKVQPVDFSSKEYVEKDEYFVSERRWALGPDGRVYAASVRDAHEIHVFRPDGALDRIIEREYTPRRRSQQDKDDFAESALAYLRALMEVDAQIEDHDPAIARLHVTDEGMLWVLTGHGLQDQPAGVMQTFDVYDQEGTLLHSLAMVCEGDGRDDLLLFPCAGRAVLIKGHRDATISQFGVVEDGGESGDGGDREGAAAMEVVCYRLPA